MEKPVSVEKVGETKRREKLLELQSLDAKIKQLEDGLVHLEEQIIEVNLIVESLKDLEQVKIDSEILVPVSNGIFVKAKIIDTQNLKINVGANTIVEKTNSEAQIMLKEQIKSIENYKNDLFSELQTLVKHASTIQTEVLINGDKE